MLQGQGTHVAIAFEVPGGWQKEKDAVVLTVLQVLILRLSLSDFMIHNAFGFCFFSLVAQKKEEMIEWK